MNDTTAGFERAQAEYDRAEPPERPDIWKVREQWYETIDPAEITLAFVGAIHEGYPFPDSWMLDMVIGIGAIFHRNVGDELGDLGAELGCNKTFADFEESYFADLEDEGPDPDAARDDEIDREADRDAWYEREMAE